MKRTLKIEERGDFFRKTTVPTIRLKGQWLERAGFTKGGTVELTVLAGGLVQLRNVEVVK